VTGLSAQAVGSIVRSLLDDGLIAETDMPRGDRPGASPIGLRVRPEGAFAIGFGIERDRLSGVILDLGGHVRWEQSVQLPPSETAASTLARMRAWASLVLDTEAWKDLHPSFCGIGVAAPGPINLASGAILGPPNFPSWEMVDLVEALSPATGLPVVIDNASTAAAVGVEWRMPRAHGSFLYCYWGVGIGGALMFEDEPYRGTTGNAVEIGHVVVDPFGRPCACGAVGCLEAEASVAALLRDASVYGHFDNVEQLAAAAAGSPGLTALLTGAAERVGAALMSALNLADVDQVVIGGEHFRAVQEIFLPVIRTWVEQRPFRRRIAPVGVSVTEMGEEAAAIGAASVALNTFVPSDLRPARA
jgi:predicted NBD/HSP70 family sugar kinase